VAGALKKHAGTVCLDGRDMTRATPEQVVRRGVAMVPETRDVFPDLSVAENLRLGAYIHRRDATGVASDQARMLALFPWLNERMQQAAGTLSGGEQQMLVIARAMMSRPKLLLLDEPSLGLAPLIVDQVFDMIGALKATGIGILLVEQNANKALAVADRAYVMRLGEIAAAGSATEIAAGSNLHTLYLGAQP
jgi:branched-chain amino acid transport system ATP-binding protein